MLLAEALTRLLYLRDSGQLPLLPEELTTNRVPTVLVQICNRTLFCQSSHGSWGANNSTEITAYAVITLVAISSLPFLQQLEKEILAALKTGRQFLSRSSERWDEAQHIWIEKTSYGSPVLSEAYCLAAMKCSTLSHTWSDHLARPPCLTKITKFFSVLPLFSKELVWKLKASVLEGSMFIKQLKSARLEIFREPLGAENKYLEFIPCTWTVMNNCNALFLSTNILWDMMQVSMLDFLVDEYMESTVAQLPEEGINSLGHIIRSLCHESEAQAKKSRKRTYSEHSNGDIAKVCVPSANRDSYSHIIKIKVTLRRYIRWVLNHPRVTSASQSDQAHLRGELQAFLLAHLIQIQDNNRFSQQGPQCGDSDSIPAFLTPRTPFYTWVHTTAADHISCPLSFAFYACIVSATFPTVSDCFPSARHKYLAQDLCTHLSIMSRLYNDFASVARDRAERNLNSVNFPEFHTPPPHSLVDESVLANMDRLKREVLLLAEYERECVRGAESALRACVLAGGRRERGVASAVRLFVAVTELYAEMYVVKDLTNRVK
ncbi:hypothetical protein MMC11_000849 [Xylographa trunciseda]|nr:hypothetical protein [Xylographa trunciseda]